MISKFIFTTGILLTNLAFATDDSLGKIDLSIATISMDKGLFHVREMHDMGKDGTQQIDYIVDCFKQTMALAGFSVISTNGKLKSTVPGSSPSTLAFYRPVIDHDKKITQNICIKLLTMNSAASK